MEKNLLICSIILAVLLIAGCTGTTTHTIQKDLPETEFHVGTQGIVLSFLKDTPPDKIYENSGLEIMVEYSNKGAFDVSGGKIYLSGFDTQYLRPVPENLPNLEAEGKSIFNPDGDITQTASFEDNSVQLPEGVDRVTQTIKATACYPYRTQASVQVCIDPKKTTTIREEICQVEPYLTVGGGQGAPIAITRVDEEIYKNKLQFRIYFENLGGGTVFTLDRAGGISDCHTSLNRQDANKIKVRSVSFSGKTMRCEPLGLITLDDRGKGFVYCYYEGDLGDDAYMTLLQIELEYGYRTSVQKNIEILQEP